MRLGRFLCLGRDGFVAVGHVHLRWNWHSHIDKVNRLCCLLQTPYTNSKLIKWHLRTCFPVQPYVVRFYGSCKNRWKAKLCLGYSPGWRCLALGNLQMSLFSSQQSMLVPCGWKLARHVLNDPNRSQNYGSGQSQTKSWIFTDSNQFQPRVAHLSLGPFTQLVDFVLDSLHFGLYLANLLSTRDAMGMHSANHW